MTNRIDISTLRPRADYARDDSTGPVPNSSTDTERTQRALADARLNVFVAGSGVPASPDCKNFDAHHDFVACGTESIDGAVLFRKESRDVDEIDVKDVQQKDIGDCYMMASLAALASTPGGRAHIKGMIREGKNENGEPTYTVTFQKPESHWFGLGKTTFSEVRITVDASYVFGHATPRKEGAFQEVWPVVVEKAFARYCGSYGAIHNGGSGALALEVLTGKEARQTRLSIFSHYGESQLQADLASGKPVVLQTRSGIGGDGGPTAARGLYAEHAYAVTGTDVIGGKLFVKLYNPWGRLDPPPVPFDELHQWFSAVDLGSVN